MGRPFTRCLFALAFAGAIACDGPSNVPPPPPPTPAPLTATSVSPDSGPADLTAEIRVTGSGFQQGAALTWDGLVLSSVTITKTTITATAPVHATGAVSLVVTNPDGRTATLAGAYTYLSPLFAVTEITPAVGLTADLIQIAGVGFRAGAAVTVDELHAATLRPSTDTVILAVVPFHADGPVDVVVTNPGGQSRRLSRGFTYGPMTLTVSSPTVAPGGTLAVSWVVPSGRTTTDWIGLYKIGDGNEVEGAIWWQDTYAATSGTLTLPAPAQPGLYEFRYFGDHHRTDHKRSATVTVAAQQSGARQ